MSSDPVTPEGLMPEIAAQLNIVVDWARHTTDTAKLGEYAEDLCMHYRALAICVLVSDGDGDEFFHWLLHSPITQRFFLNTAHAEGISGSRYMRASFVDPVLDAIAARQWKLAADIVGMSSADWMDGFEYEDDFCYGEFIRRMVSGRADGFEALFARWRAVLDGQRDPRLDVAAALAAKNVPEFEEGLRELLRVQEAKARKMADPMAYSPLADELPFSPNRWVSIEGLALLALAERDGISVDDDVDACPRLVRPGTYAPFRSLAYPDLGLD